MALNNLERLRKGFTELTQKELAEKVGLSLSDYKRLISGEREITVSEANRFAKHFSVHQDVITDKVEIAKTPRAEESPMTYNKVLKQVQLLVTIDGDPKTLESCIATLTLMSRALSPA